MKTNSAATSVEIGSRIKALREERGLSLRALAQASLITPNALSQIEHGHVSPSVSTLNRLAGALGVPITIFFDVGAPRESIVFVKADQRTRVPFARGLMEGLGGELFAGRVEPFFLTLEAGGNSGLHPVVHTGHEFVFCVRGVLEYTVESSVFQLEAGDSLLFASHLRHRWRNPGGTVTNAIIVLSGFDEAERPAARHVTAEDKE
jgi:transcriptional regulator with XRE-family HTH domain